MFNISKVPVLILSTPRTGSTALGAHLSSILGPDVKFFNEPDFAMTTHMTVFEEFYKTSNQFVLKLHAFNARYYNKEIMNYLKTSPDVYKISISRKDITAQITSLYIARKRGNKWHYNYINELNSFNDLIEIDKNLIEVCVRDTIGANYALKHADVNFDEHVFYEDIPSIKVKDTSWFRQSEDTAEFFKSPKPSNYEDLYNTIKDISEQLVY